MVVRVKSRWRWKAQWRWIVVAAVVAVLASLPSLVSALPVPAQRVSAAQLYDRIRASARQAYQGFAVSTGKAGLPTIPQLGDVAGLLNGDTQLRVWYAAPDRWRVDQIDTGSERDLYQAPGRQVLWDFGARQLTEITGNQPVRLPRGADLVPPDLARRLLATAAPSQGQAGDRLSTLPARRVAGIAAAGLRITPADPETTVGHVDVWAAPASGLPLQVEVTVRGASTPILVTRFLQVSLGNPAGALITPPEPHSGVGFTVTRTPDVIAAYALLGLGSLPDQLAGRTRSVVSSVEPESIGVFGSGLTRFVVLPLPRRTGAQAANSVTRAGGRQLNFPGGEGVVVSTPLLSVLVMDSDITGRNYLLAGLVSGSLLERAGSELSTYSAAR
jgi:hypothetical protein